MLSFVHEGKVLDWKFIKRNNVHYFYTGDIYQGQIHKIGKSWDVPCDGLDIPKERRLSISGFRTRYDAAHYILYLRYYFPEHLKELEELEARVQAIKDEYAP